MSTSNAYASDIYEAIYGLGDNRYSTVDDRLNSVVERLDDYLSEKSPSYQHGDIMKFKQDIHKSLNKHIESAQKFTSNVAENGLVNVLYNGKMVNVNSHMPEYIYKAVDDVVSNKLNLSNNLNFEKIVENGRFKDVETVSNATAENYLNSGVSVSEYYRWSDKCMSEDVLRKHASKFSDLDWKTISSKQPLSKEFIADYADKLDINRLQQNRHISKKEHDYVTSAKGLGAIAGKKLAKYDILAGLTKSEISTHVDNIKNAFMNVTKKFIDNLSKGR